MPTAKNHPTTPGTKPAYVPEIRREFSAANRFKSAQIAIKGARIIFATQHSIWIQSGVILFFLLLAALLGISRVEWALIIFASALLLVAEALNTAVEATVDFICPEFNPAAGRIKDIAAGAVAIAALPGIVIAGLVFGPRLWALLG
mgnify:CR=1 FL=1